MYNEWPVYLTIEQELAGSIPGIFIWNVSTQSHTDIWIAIWLMLEGICKIELMERKANHIHRAAIR